MTNQDILDQIQNLPSRSGIYQYIDSNSKLLYIGKAKNLKARVKSYWRFKPHLHPNPTLNARVVRMLNQTDRLEYTVVESEEDALILENSLIKQLRPKYNILLRDDKTYPYIYIDESQNFPRFEITRKVLNGKQIHYYGPFPAGAKSLLDAIYEIYPLVQKKSCVSGGKACLFYQIEKCLAPCEERITSKEYHAIISEAKKAISNKRMITEKLYSRMGKLALQNRFEEAAKIRDQISIIDSLQISSSIDMANSENIDLFSIVQDKKQGVVVRLFIRNGKVVSSSHNFFYIDGIFDIDRAFRQVLLNFYTQKSPSTPNTILVSEEFESIFEVSNIIRDRLGRAINIKHPKRGDKKKLIDLSLLNAKELMRKKDKSTEINEQIKRLLSLAITPCRVEVFDNSHMMGDAAVGAMVVYNSGQWDKNSYRKYKLAAKEEYGQMLEMLQRRISRFDTEPPPDLWLLDGGVVNLNLAKKLLKTIGVNLDVVAIAKEKLDSKAHRAKGSARDTIYTEYEVLNLEPTDKRLHWLQKLRDEAHRFAISYHQNLKRKVDQQISLLEKRGIGHGNIQKLINYFGSFENISIATYEEIAKATNSKIADIICSNRMD